MPRNQARLHPVESLESRVLLAASDIPDHGTALALVEAAIVDNGAAIAVELLPYNEVLRITGTGDGNISINLSHLPASVVNLQISSFESVTLTGEATLRDLVLIDVTFADAGNVALDRLFTYEVGHLRIETAPDVVMLQGPGNGTVGGPILLEAGRFSSSPQAVIFAMVESLGLATTSHVESLPPISGLVTQSILLNFQPDQPITTSHQGTVSVIRGGEFVRYFLSSPDERTSLEQSLLIARQSARVDLVPLSDLLNNPALQSALSTGPETGFGLARIAEGPMLDNGLSGSRFGAESELLQAATLLLDAAGDESPEPSAAGVASDFFLTESDIRSASIPEHVATFAENSAAEAIVEEAGFEIIEPSQLMLLDADDLAGAAALALARLGEPLAQMVFDFQGRFATFGDMAAARLSDNLRSDTRPALLVDARPTRQRDGIEVVSV